MFLDRLGCDNVHTYPKFLSSRQPKKKKNKANADLAENIVFLYEPRIVLLSSGTGIWFPCDPFYFLSNFNWLVIYNILF